MKLKKKDSIWPCLLLLIALLPACQSGQPDSRSFTVRNPVDLDRESETISVALAEVGELVQQHGPENLLIKTEADEVLVTQLVDNDMDGNPDELLFQTSLQAGEQKRFTVQSLQNGASLQPKSAHTTYSRFVPERTDDYTWENDRVAFRTYGPVAQQLVETGQPGGTLTSGIDAWLKRVSYPIIDKWYKSNDEDPGFYHIDHGEGYDPYHVGASRGIGGLGFWENDSLYVSRNFTEFRAIAEGPIRTIFELSYAPWQANGRTIREKKRISLDLGHNLSRFEVTLQSKDPLPFAAIGITLHDQRGEVRVNQQQGWFRYWEPMDDSALGLAVVVDPKSVEGYKDNRVRTADQSHLLIFAKPTVEKVVYHAGFGWQKSGQFSSVADWDQHLANYAQRVANPVQVVFE